ncbi:PREDICTED: putative pentatricopeptide repeat-containing protein At3g01580 [Nicotiana attenuata]|uniref:Pentatricopeptide repeat-containing protein n=1 Tax=Nicotiana attenuata TaxID=49451 RepID=A0A1J6IFT4_NICAT|nr:PREDICTED: putative pentatricopeptide repeat-containing protein At3g01580 [Nicotiana attenuata]OIT03726.1 putative pentatricopeptide repeat-containing protein [Nicotiana attenuata]
MRSREIVLKLVGVCTTAKLLTQLHSLIIRTGLNHDIQIAAKLTELYIELLPVQTARKVFDEIPQPSGYTCNRILQRFCGIKRYGEVLSLFSSMFSFEKPDHFTLLFVLKACSALNALNFGRLIHGFGIKHGNIHSNMFLGSALIEFYSKCGDMDDALRVFEEYTKPDLVLWTTLVTGYEQSFKPDEALAVFTGMMMTHGVSPDPVTLVTVVSACTQLLNLKAGKSVHGLVIRMNNESPLPVSNALLNLYAKTGSIEYAGNLFRMMEEKDVISWSCIISCCAHNGATDRAISLFDEMIHKGVEPNSVSVISALQASEACCNLEKGRQIHELAFQKGLELDILVSTALIDMYMSCCSPKEAIMVFDRMLNKDDVSWFSLLCGCVQNGMFYKSMQIFCDMMASDIQPDATVMVKTLVACSELGIIQLTSCLHGYVIRGGFTSNSFVGASLIECYAKCGSLEEADKVFEGLTDKDVVIWSSMFASYGIHGQARESVNLFHRMVTDSTVRPNKVTFLSILAACSHAGLVEEGIEFFNMMLYKYQLMPESKHYAIIVDLLGRTGELDKAMCFINQMQSQVGAHVWGALFGACRIHQNAEIGEAAARNLLQFDPDHAGYYILLSNMYAVDGKWDDAAELRSAIKEKQLKKITGHSVVRL